MSHRKIKYYPVVRFFKDKEFTLDECPRAQENGYCEYVPVMGDALIESNFDLVLRAISYEISIIQVKGIRIFGETHDYWFEID